MCATLLGFPEHGVAQIVKRLVGPIEDVTLFPRLKKS